VQKSNILLVGVGCLVSVGIVLSFFGNQMIFEDLAKSEGVIKVGNKLEISTELDETVNKNGIYAVQILDFKEGMFSASVYDPLGIEIESQSINKEVFEGKFDIISSGTYLLVIESNSQDESKVYGVIGPEPDAGVKSIGFISLYILVIGLVGMVGVAIYAIKNRRK
jgi:hypothetical protein